MAGGLVGEAGEVGGPLRRADFGKMSPPAMASVLRLANSDEMDHLREGYAALQPWLASCEDPTRKRRYLHVYQDGRYSEVLPEPLQGV